MIGHFELRRCCAKGYAEPGTNYGRDADLQAAVVTIFGSCLFFAVFFSSLLLSWRRARRRNFPVCRFGLFGWCLGSRFFLSLSFGFGRLCSFFRCGRLGFGFRLGLRFSFRRFGRCLFFSFTDRRQFLVADFFK